MYVRHRDPTGTSAQPGSFPSAAAFSYLPDIADAYVASLPEPADTVLLRGVSVHRLTEAACVERICTALSAGLGGTVVTPNLDHLRRCATDATFRSLVADAELVVADGMPLVWASRLQGTPLPERVAGSNLIVSLSAAAASHRYSVFLLGGAPGTAQLAAGVLRTRFPGLTVAGTCCPPQGFERDPDQVAALAAQLASSDADIVYVALGSPKQEKLIERLRPTLPRAWWLGVGISFSFLCGDVRRAPLWMQSAGLEWVHRLVQEPRRLLKRYLVTGVPFAADLLVRSAVKGAMRRVLRRGNDTTDVIVSNATSAAAPTPASLPMPLAPAVARPLELQFFATATSTAKGRPAVTSRLRALVLLGGSVRPTPLHLATGRSVLDLPLDRRGSVLAGWLAEAAALRRALGLDSLPVRVMVNHGAPVPTSVEGFIAKAAGLQIEQDASEYRGTGGVLHDLADDYDDDDLLLVANAAQVLLDPLAGVVDALARRGGDVTVVSHQDGTPSGVMLVACRALRDIAAEGFVDMKEQALPRIAARFDVRVLSRRRPSGLPLRTLEDYVSALRHHHRFRNGGGFIDNDVADPLAENLSSAFALVEPDAQVDPSARLHDAVVLAGGVVEAGSVLVRSVVCPGGVVRRERATVDRFVTDPAAGKHSIGRRRKDRVA